MLMLAGQLIASFYINYMS